MLGLRENENFFDIKLLIHKIVVYELTVDILFMCVIKGRSQFSISIINPISTHDIQLAEMYLLLHVSHASLSGLVSGGSLLPLHCSFTFFFKKLVMDSDGCQVIGPPTSGQALNAAIVNSLFKLHHAISKVLFDLNSKIVA